jgi:ATP-dependent RNA helicase RhlE
LHACIYLARAKQLKDKILSFENLGLKGPILNTLAGQGYEKPTSIQTQAIPAVLQGRDVVGLAQTGTGKTAAFSLPLLQRMSQHSIRRQPGSVRVLIVSPTRELAAQIETAVRTYSNMLAVKSACIFGGVSARPQRQALKAGVDVLVATPGRLLDLVDQKIVRLDLVEAIVLDEADQMLDIGFLPAIRRILAMVPEKRQTLLFSATMPKEIRKLSTAHLTDPVEVSVAPVATTADNIEQSVLHMPREAKLAAIANLLREHAGTRTIVFTRTKRGADRVVRKLSADGIGAAAIHGNKSQGQRERALAAFRKGSCPVLIATDIAARGIDVPGVGLVVNYELPNVPQAYVHRIGRTARAGASGIAVSLCSPDEYDDLRDIERLIRLQIPATGEVPSAAAKAKTGPAKAKTGRPTRRRRPPRRYRPSSKQKRAA